MMRFVGLLTGIRGIHGHDSDFRGTYQRGYPYVVTWKVCGR
jgi:hypothetical protein